MKRVVYGDHEDLLRLAKKGKKWGYELHSLEPAENITFRKAPLGKTRGYYKNHNKDGGLYKDYTKADIEMFRLELHYKEKRFLLER